MSDDSKNENNWSLDNISPIAGSDFTNEESQLSQVNWKERYQLMCRAMVIMSLAVLTISLLPMVLVFGFSIISLFISGFVFVGTAVGLCVVMFSIRNSFQRNAERFGQEWD